MKTFIIHLERATARRAQVDALIADSPCEAEVLPAVDGRTLSHWPIAERFAPRYPFALGPGEVGCFLSHRLAWQRILDDGLEDALILEDDVALDAGFDASFAAAAAHVAELGYIQFQTRPLKTKTSTIAVERDRDLVRPDVTPLRTSAQLVHREAAARLLEVTQTFDRPVDCLLQMHWETGVRVHVVTPSCVSDRTAETGGSTISGSRRGVLENLRRGLARHRYRQAIARLSQ